MATALPASDLRWTVEAFDRWHAQQPQRWQLIAGVPLMMSPPTLAHAVIKSNLGSRLAGSPYRVLVEGAEVKARGLSASPDVVLCGPLDWTTPTVREPLAIVEVLSPPGERDDSYRKWQGYCTLLSLRHHVEVVQEARFVTARTRTGPSSFDVRVYQEGVIELPGIEVSLSLDEIYADVEFPEPARCLRS